MSGDTIALRACAKINWTLEVLGRRRDGYHELRTVLQTVALRDDVALTTGREAALDCSAPAGW
ncbi:MAG TPA: 4-(cytidine 5'-diphospho)-2-C-methyl-D-erythritol kinase, partial [Dehalococcoidia bacterium]